MANLCEKRHHLHRKFPYLCLACPRYPKRALTTREIELMEEMMRNCNTWDKMAVRLWEMDSNAPPPKTFDRRNLQ